ncbi:MAG: YjbQ family protein [Ignavibacteriales bacterium]|nr:YjbQ family protein [Ignavibacteriales bacterium]
MVTEHIEIQTKGQSEVIDITERVASILHDARLMEGSATIFVAGSTASISTTEFEPGLQRDIPSMLNTLIPKEQPYHHDNTWHDGNGFSHLRATLMGPTLTVPFAKGKLLLGTWQQIVLIDHDNRSRHRSLVVQLIGQQ